MSSPEMVLRRLLGWLPEGGASRRLLVVFFIDAVGTGLFLAGSALFFTRVIGLSSAEVGLGLSLSAVVGFVCSVPIGRLADRYGSRRTLIALYVSRAVGFLAYLFVDDVAGFIAVACLLGASQWAAGPLVQALVGAAVNDESRVRTMATMNVFRNAGFVIGALLATAAIASESELGFRALVVGNAISFLLTSVLLARMRLAKAEASGAKRAARGERVRVHDPRYVLLATANGVLFLHTVLLAVGLPLYITTRSEAPPTILGAVFVLNTAAAIVLGIRLSKGVDDPVSGGARHLWAGLSLAACCVLVALSDGMGPGWASVLLLAATLCLTLGELWQSIGQWALSYALSPEDQRGLYLTVFNLGEPVAAMVGPAMLTIAVMPAGSLGWLCLAAVFALTGLAVRAITVRASVPASAAPGLGRPRAASAEGAA